MAATQVGCIFGTSNQKMIRSKLIISEPRLLFNTFNYDICDCIYLVKFRAPSMPGGKHL